VHAPGAAASPPQDTATEGAQRANILDDEIVEAIRRLVAALQIAAQHAFGREGRPSPAELLDLAEAWRPWRGVAARVLWAWYPNIRRTKQPEPV
jgi:nucleotide-binding universal stress UspA family protein